MRLHEFTTTKELYARASANNRRYVSDSIRHREACERFYYAWSHPETCLTHSRKPSHLRSFTRASFLSILLYHLNAKDQTMSDPTRLLKLTTFATFMGFIISMAIAL